MQLKKPRFENLNLPDCIYISLRLLGRGRGPKFSYPSGLTVTLRRGVKGPFPKGGKRFMDIYGHLWTHEETYGHLWTPTDSRDPNG